MKTIELHPTALRVSLPQSVQSPCTDDLQTSIRLPIQTVMD
jgi:hypothetical protein